MSICFKSQGIYLWTDTLSAGHLSFLYVLFHRTTQSNVLSPVRDVLDTEPFFSIKLWAPCKFLLGVPRLCCFLRASWVFTKMRFSQTSRHLDSCIGLKTNVPVQHSIILLKYMTPTGGYHKSHNRENQMRLQACEKREINQRSLCNTFKRAAYFTVQPFKNIFYCEKFLFPQNTWLQQ